MRMMLLCLLCGSVLGCDDSGSTSGPQSVPQSTDMSATAPPGGDLATAGADMVTSPSFPQTAAVTVGPNNSLSYAPATVDIAAGGTVTWTWAPGITMPHTVTSGDTP